MDFQPPWVALLSGMQTINEKLEQLASRQEQLASGQEQLASGQEQLASRQESGQMDLQTVKSGLEQLALKVDNLAESMNVDPWDMIHPQHRFTSNSSSTSGGKNFRKALETECGNTCQVTGVSDPKALKAAHIWPKSQARLLPVQTQYPVHSAKNGIMLAKAVEEAFDKRQVCFIKNPLSSQIEFCVLDSGILEQEAASGLKFAAIHGRPLNMSRHSPSYTLLSLHAGSALKKAMREQSTSDAKLDSIINATQFASPPKPLPIDSWITRSQPLEVGALIGNLVASGALTSTYFR